MAWFRRRSRSASPPADHHADPECIAEPRTDIEVVPVASATALSRTERALTLLAEQHHQLADTLQAMEHRVDALAAAIGDHTERHADDVAGVRRHGEKVAAELRRLEINLTTRLEAVRAELDAVAGAAPSEVDLRVLTPNDTGWQPARSA